jgi:hypothetical protein
MAPNNEHTFHGEGAIANLEAYATTVGHEWPRA